MTWHGDTIFNSASPTMACRRRVWKWVWRTVESEESKCSIRSLVCVVVKDVCTIAPETTQNRATSCIEYTKQQALQFRRNVCADML